ncbi:MAG: hypothetical protein MJY99_11600 [Fibrobacter sp.]|nr:hypothetical protein [Fibrobacter sp.]
MNKLTTTIILMFLAFTTQIGAAPNAAKAGKGTQNASKATATAPQPSTNVLQQAMETLNVSKLLYAIEFLEKPIRLPDRSANLNFTARQEETDKGIVVKAFKPEGEAKKMYHAAELDFESHKFAAAREKYKKTMLIDPSQTWMMTFIAQTYGIEKKFNEAESWYKKSIEANYIDYLAHWLLADIYMLKGEKQKAIFEISVAKVLNRNNPNLERKRKEVYAANGLDSTSWTFHPQAIVEKSTANKVTIKADSLWMHYAIVKAAWENEPEFRESRIKNSPRKNKDEVKELDCILGLLLPNADKKGIPVIDRLNKAMDANKLEEFMFYEITLLDHPDFAYYLEPEKIMSLADYLVLMARK